jgi:FkbM family methyltransferase
MNLFRFVKKCATDQTAAWRSAKLVMRSLRGRVHWCLQPTAPLRYRLPDGGVLLLEPGHSFTIGFWPAVDQYEPEVAAALHHYLKPGNTFIDAGANVGYFSVLAGRLVGPSGQVFSIEANPGTLLLLQRHLEINKFGNAIQAALGRENGKTILFEPKKGNCVGGDAYSSLRLGGLVQEEHAISYPVPARRLDTLLVEQGIKKVDVLKIDIEGGELDALEFAPCMLSEMRPVIIMEYGTNTWPSFGATKERLYQLLHKHNYRAMDASANKTIDINDAAWGLPYVNFVLRPAEYKE